MLPSHQLNLFKVYQIYRQIDIKQADRQAARHTDSHRHRQKDTQASQLRKFSIDLLLISNYHLSYLGNTQENDILMFLQVCFHSQTNLNLKNTMETSMTILETHCRGNKKIQLSKPAAILKQCTLYSLLCAPYSSQCTLYTTVHCVHRTFQGVI